MRLFAIALRVNEHEPAITPGDTFRVPAVTLVDGAVRYDFGTARPALKGRQAALNVSNLLDRNYVASCFNAGGCVYGNGRIVTTSLGYRL